jgi:S1-C subfamily serine protease
VHLWFWDYCTAFFWTLEAPSQFTDSRWLCHPSCWKRTKGVLAMDGGNSLIAFSQALATTVEQVAPRVVAVHGGLRMSSSGVYWQPGIIVTADHTVKRDEELTVTLADERTVPVILLGRDSTTDIAILRVEQPITDLPSPTELLPLKVGHIVLALGRAETGIQASFGIVAALGGAWRTWRGGHIDQFLKLDLNLSPSAPGGALVDCHGQVLGINTLGPHHRVLAIPSVTVQRVVDQILQRGQVRRGYLGIGMQPVRLPEFFQRLLGWPQNSGVIIVTLEIGGPADQAGFLIGDVLVNLADHPITDTPDVQTVLLPEQVGKTITAQVIRGGQAVALTVTVGERPQRER